MISNYVGICLLCLNLMNLQITWYHFIRARFVVLAIRINVRKKLCPLYLETPPNHHQPPPRPERWKNRQHSYMIFM